MNLDNHQTTGQESEGKKILQEISESLDLAIPETAPADNHVAASALEAEEAVFDANWLKNMGVCNWKRVVSIANKRKRYLVGDYIPDRSVGILVGGWGIGKSPFALQLQMALAIGGIKFLGRYECPKEPKRTLYVDLENSPSKIADLTSRFAEFYGCEEPPPTWETYSPNYSKVRPADARVVSEYSFILDIARKGMYDFIIIDPLRMFSPDAEGSNPDGARVIQDFRGLIREAKATILLVHHTHKPKVDGPLVSLDDDPHFWMRQASGAGALVANVDFRIAFEQRKDGDVLTRHYVRGEEWSPTEYLVHVLDQNDCPIAYKLEGGIDRLSEHDKGVFDSLPDQFTTEEIRTALNRGSNPTNKRLKQWVSLGLIEKAERGVWTKTGEVATG